MTVSQRYVSTLTVASALVFEHAAVEALVADDDAMRDAEQFVVRELDAGTRIPIVEHGVEARCRQFGIKALGHFLHAWRFLHVHRDQRQVEGSEGFRPDDALGIVILFDGRRYDARHTDAIASHGHDDCLALLVEHGGVQRRAVLPAELENVTHLDAACDAADVPLPVGLGSPAITLRMSTTSPSGRSRPQLTPVRCMSRSLAPQTKSAACAAARST